MAANLQKALKAAKKGPEATSNNSCPLILALFGKVTSELATLVTAIGSAAVGGWSIAGLNYS
jgi:hypothetical protein